MQMWKAIWLLTAVILTSIEISVQAKRDYYEILGIDRSATPKQIKKAFRKEAAKYHPDKNKNADAEDKFKEINEAHEVLMDTEKRRQYDTFGHQNDSGSKRSSYSSGGPDGFTFHFDSSDEIFRNFFEQDFRNENPKFHFNHRDFHNRQYQRPHHQPNFFSYSDFFEEDEPAFGDYFGSAPDPHRFGSGSSFFGSHFGRGGYQESPPHQEHWGYAQATGSRCKTVTQRVGNMVTTYTQCS